MLHNFPYYPYFTDEENETLCTEVILLCERMGFACDHVPLSAVMNIRVRVSLSILVSLVCMPSSGIDGS